MVGRGFLLLSALELLDVSLELSLVQPPELSLRLQLLVNSFHSSGLRLEHVLWGFKVDWESALVGENLKSLRVMLLGYPVI